MTDLRRSARKPWRTLNSTYYATLAKTLPFANLPSQLQVQAVPPTAASPTGAATKAGMFTIFNQPQSPYSINQTQLPYSINQSQFQCIQAMQFH